MEPGDREAENVWTQGPPQGWMQPRWAFVSTTSSPHCTPCGCCCSTCTGLHKAFGSWRSDFLLEALFATFELTTEKARPSEGCSNWGPRHPEASRRVVGTATSVRWGLLTPCPVPHPSHPTFSQATLLLSLLYAGILIFAALGKEREGKCPGPAHRLTSQVRGPLKVTQ